MRALALVALAGCIDIADEGEPWIPADGIAGMELGPVPTLRASAGCRLRIASWNLHWVGDPQQLLANLASSSKIAGADVILVQESAHWPGEPVSRTAQLAEALAMTWAHDPVALLPNGVMQGNAIISRLPLEQVAVKRLPHVEQPYRGQPRRALAADVVLGDARLRVVNVHLDIRLSITDRIRQLDPVASDLDERAVVGGDFNTAPWQWIEGVVPVTSTQAVVGLDQARIVDDFMASRRYASAISADTTTFPLPGVAMRLDNLYPRALAILDAGVEHVRGSDHWPIWVDLDVCR
jgi:endonuclease/exonuclease/phosphatase family metal-dependent hydrolase